MTPLRLSEHFGHVRCWQVEEIVRLHRQYGLALNFSRAKDVAVTFGDSPPNLVTELLRLALIGAMAEGRVSAGGEYSALAEDAALRWQQGIRP